jgi:hypothetical protein
MNQQPSIINPRTLQDLQEKRVIALILTGCAFLPQARTPSNYWEKYINLS